MENQLSRYGAIAQAMPFTPGKIFFVVESADSWAADFINQYPVDKDGVVRVYTDIQSAYNATVDGRNDVIVLDSNTSHTLTAMLTVSKNKVHFVSTEWLAGAHRVQDQRCRVVMNVSATVTNVAMIRVTGSGCSFRGIKFVNSSTLAQSITTFQDESSNGLLVENCSIQASGSAQLTATTGSSLRLAGDGSHYYRCQIGADTIVNTVANQVVYVATINGAVARRVLFEECEFYTYTSATTHVFVKVAADADVDRYISFKNCDFHNFYTASNGALMAVAFQTPAGLISGLVHVSNPNVFGATDFATAAVGNAGILINGTSPTAGTAGIAVQPTA